MPLTTTGTISFQDINIEARGVGYGSSQIDLNSGTIRDLANKTTAGSAVAATDFYGKTGGVDMELITPHKYQGSNVTIGYAESGFGGYGYLYDAYCAFRNNTNRIYWLYQYSTSAYSSSIRLAIQGRAYGNTGFTEMEIRPLTTAGYPYIGYWRLPRVNATYSEDTYYNYSSWVWSAQGRPFGYGGTQMRVYFR